MLLVPGMFSILGHAVFYSMPIKYSYPLRHAKFFHGISLQNITFSERWIHFTIFKKRISVDLNIIYVEFNSILGFLENGGGIDWGEVV